MGLFRFFGSAATDDESKLAESTEITKQRIEVEVHEDPRFDSVAVLESAGVDATQRERVERTLELLNALPADASPQLRKNIVEASFKAFDISIKAIVDSADAEMVAFDGFIEQGHKHLTALREESLARVAQLEAEIAKIQRKLELATADQAKLDDWTAAAMNRVRPIASFFGDAARNSETRVANDRKGEHPATIIVDDSLLKTG